MSSIKWNIFWQLNLLIFHGWQQITVWSVRPWLIMKYLILIMRKLSISIAIFEVKKLVKKHFCRSQIPLFTKDAKRMHGLSMNCWRSNGLNFLLGRFIYVILPSVFIFSWETSSPRKEKNKNNCSLGEMTVFNRSSQN